MSIEKIDALLKKMTEASMDPWHDRGDDPKFGRSEPDDAEPYQIDPDNRSELMGVVADIAKQLRIASDSIKKSERIGAIEPMIEILHDLGSFFRFIDDWYAVSPLDTAWRDIYRRYYKTGVIKRKSY